MRHVSLRIIPYTVLLLYGIPQGHVSPPSGPSCPVTTERYPEPWLVAVKVQSIALIVLDYRRRRSMYHNWQLGPKVLCLQVRLYRDRRLIAVSFCSVIFRGMLATTSTMRSAVQGSKGIRLTRQFFYWGILQRIESRTIMGMYKSFIAGNIVTCKNSGLLIDLDLKSDEKAISRTVCYISRTLYSCAYYLFRFFNLGLSITLFF